MAGDGDVAELALQLAPDVRAARDGDEEAFGRLVAATHGIVTAVAGSVLRDPDVVADVAQEVFFAAWRGMHRLRQPESFLPWLRRITRNRARDALRARRGAQQRGGATSPDAPEAVLAALPAPDPSPIDAIIAAEERATTRRALAAAIAALPTGSRELLMLHYGARRPAPELARILGLKEAAVRQRLVRVRARVRESLTPAAVTPRHDVRLSGCSRVYAKDRGPTRRAPQARTDRRGRLDDERTRCNAPHGGGD